jgi:hypothetical protein
MSDPVALVCVRGAGPPDAAARRWRRRATGAHSVRTTASLAQLPVPRAGRFGMLRRALVALLVGAASWGGLSVLRAHSGDSAFSRRIGAGCEELEPCLSLEAEAERRLDACALGCDREAAELAAARQMRFRAEERRAVREHYRERERDEQAERQRERDQQRAAWQRERAARAEEAANERQHRLELERLRQQHIDRRVAEERQRRVGYLAVLGPEGRALRLKRCLEKSKDRCDALTLDLLDAARDDDERRALAEANEGIVDPAPKPKAEAAVRRETPAEETSSEAPTPSARAASPPAGRDEATPVPSS